MYFFFFFKKVELIIQSSKISSMFASFYYVDTAEQYPGTLEAISSFIFYFPSFLEWSGYSTLVLDVAHVDLTKSGRECNIQMKW